MAQARDEWRASQGELNPERLVFIDETGAATDMARRYGRCPRGQRLVSSVPWGHWKTTTFVAALRVGEIAAPCVFDGPMDGPSFRAYVEQFVVPILRESGIVVMDNLPSHKVAGIREAIEAAGAELRYLPSYSNTPGRTQAINFFEIRWPGRPRPELIFADLPGYGYARVPREVSRSWPTFIEPYLAERRSLSLCLCLVDANIPPQPSDTNMIDYLRQTQRPLVVVAHQSRSRRHPPPGLAQCPYAGPRGRFRTSFYSAKSGLGQDELWKRLRAAGAAASGESA